MRQHNKINSQKVLFAFLAMVMGGLLMIILVVSFNKTVKKKEEKVKQPTRYVKMKKSVKKTTKPKPKPKPKPKKAPPKAPLPNLNSLLGGIKMDIPEFATDNITGDASDILGEIADNTMSDGSVDTKPRAVSRSAMEYPKSAMKKGIKGYVVVNLLIATDGSVEMAQILESNPAGVFDSSALSGVRSWRFSPAKYRGKPIKVWAKQKIRFDFN